MIFTILTVIIGLVSLIYIFFVWNFNYWKKRNVNGPKPKPFFGSYPSVFTQKDHIAVDIKEIYEYVFIKFILKKFSL